MATKQTKWLQNTLKRNQHRTSQSSSVVRFDNLTKGLTLTSINYIVAILLIYEINEKFYYITFIMDCFSRYILGYAVSDRLSSDKTALLALNKR